MNDSIPLGRIAGIRVGAHWSLAVVFLLITWSLASAQLPIEVPGQPVAAYWIVALVTAALFFGSLLAHELGHALLARSRGMEIEGITLWLFGGVAKFRADAEGPRTELIVTAIGPGISIGLAAVFLVVAIVLAAAGVPPLLTAAVTWLGLINGILGVFNLLPAFPLDGGRVLRALLWMRSGDLRRATTTSARVGGVIAYLLIALGIVGFFAGDFLDGVWLAFLGWFLLAAGNAEAQSSVAHDALAGLRVADLMTPEPAVLPGWTTIDDLLQRHLLSSRHSSYPVVGFDGELVGLVTLDVLRGLTPEQRATSRLQDVARPLSRVLTVGPSEPAADLVGRLASAPGGRALVLDGGRLVGIVSPTDVTRTLAIADLDRDRRVRR